MFFCTTPLRWTSSLARAQRALARIFATRLRKGRKNRARLLQPLPNACLNNAQLIRRRERKPASTPDALYTDLLTSAQHAAHVASSTASPSPAELRGLSVACQCRHHGKHGRYSRAVRATSYFSLTAAPCKPRPSSTLKSTCPNVGGIIEPPFSV
jgi:hypothetical protein